MSPESHPRDRTTRRPRPERSKECRPLMFVAARFGFACGDDQFVASLTPNLSQTRFLTYVTAQYGAVPAYVAVDAQGNVLIAGTTSAPSYPTTPGTYQPNYMAASGTIYTCGPPIPVEFTSPSGYVSLRKGGRVWSDLLDVFQREQE